ncbi:microfibril-associated glycoprotein 4-like isoform 2-T2 [Discoglossus pictus]
MTCKYMMCLDLHVTGTRMETLLVYLALFLLLKSGHVTPDTASKTQNNASACVDPCYPHDCSDVLRAQGQTSDGVYLIYPSGPYSPGVPVYCDMTSQGGPWTIFQKRFDGSVEFYRGWDEYKTGFGKADGEYWLGLRNIHLLTLKRPYRLRVDLEDWDNEKRFVTYSEFSLSRFAISPEEDSYKLEVKGFQEGNEHKPAAKHNGTGFSTNDHDEDKSSSNCALKYRGAFWFHSCLTANLNGKYLNGPIKEDGIGMVWGTWRGHRYSLKKSEMKIAWPE